MKKYIILFGIMMCMKILSMFMLQNLLTYMNYFLTLIVISYSVYTLFRRKNCFSLEKCVLIVCMIAVAAMPVVPNQAVTIGKFYLLKPFYQQSIETIANDFSERSNTDNYQSQLSIPSRFLLNNCEKNVICRIYKEAYTISFTQYRDFFRYYAYVYFSEPKAIDFVTTPGRYWVGHDNANAYDNITWIEQDKWALVKYY